MIHRKPAGDFDLHQEHPARRLIGVKVSRSAAGIVVRHQMEDVMSIGSILVSAAVLSAVAIFVAGLIRGDFQRQPARRRTSDRRHRAF
jgi:hypothetical protein